jgi:hypothetical protein
MTTQKTPAQKQPATDADARSVDRQSGKSKTTSGDEKSHEKAGTDQGAGGGKKQERYH